jgi:propionyl-CoA synthetase
VPDPEDRAVGRVRQVTSHGNLARMSGEYRQAYDRSMTDPDGFWREAAGLIDWYTEPTTIMDSSALPFSRWFAGGELNTCYNCLDRHVDAGRGDQLALVHDSPVTQSVTRYTYAELRDEVARFAGVLRSVGVDPGDRVIIYMPMIPQAAIAMLACARLGAVHSVVFGGFAARELAVRIDDAKPSAIVSASCGIEGKRVVEYKPLLDKAIELAEHDPGRSIVFQRPQAEASMTDRDVDWAQALESAEPTECVSVAADDPLYVLYTSGTTGKPKGVQRDNGGHAVALRWSMQAVFDVGPGEVMFTASDVGWVVGHSYIVYAPLLTGATTVLYEGKPIGTPDAGQFWRVVADHGVKALFTAPTAFRGIKKEDPEASYLGQYDVSSLQTLFLAGERLDPETYHWASEKLGIPVVDHWWQTETGWPIAANLRGLEPMELKPGSPSVPVPGYQIEILDVDGTPLPRGEEGAIVIKLPLPPGCLQTLWNDDERFRESYMSRYEGYYLTGDGGYLDEDGYLFVMGRTDDVINVAGHRLSTGSMEEVLSGHPDVAECAVIGVTDQMKGQVPRGFVVLKAGVERTEDELGPELVAMVRDQVGAVASFKDVAVVPALPKTRSGKVLRKTMRSIADGKDEAVPSTIDDASVLDTLRPVLQKGPLGG